MPSAGHPLGAVDAYARRYKPALMPPARPVDAYARCYKPGPHVPLMPPARPVDAYARRYKPGQHVPLMPPAGHPRGAVDCYARCYAPRLRAPSTGKRRDEPGVDLHLRARGLKPGSHGFCTVVSTQGIPASLAQRLEALSGYRHVFPPQDPNSRLNPVLFSHLIVSLSGRRCDVLSRVCDAGLDHTQRTNKFAHHVVLDSARVRAGRVRRGCLPRRDSCNRPGTACRRSCRPAVSRRRSTCRRRFAGPGSRSRATPDGAAPWPRRRAPARAARR